MYNNETIEDGAASTYLHKLIKSQANDIRIPWSMDLVDYY